MMKSLVKTKMKKEDRLELIREIFNAMKDVDDIDKVNREFDPAMVTTHYDTIVTCYTDAMDIAVKRNYSNEQFDTLFQDNLAKHHVSQEEINYIIDHFSLT